MLLEEFDVEKYERSLRAEGREQGERVGEQRGERIGEKRGERRGEQRGISRSNELTRILLEQGRIEDLKRAASDREYQEGLFQEFHL